MQAVQAVQQLLSRWENAWILCGLLLLFETLLSAIIILKRPYTKIDWDAYMQEVEGPMQQGQWDYSQLRGETGPLVYPAGFVWLYGALRYVCGGDGSNVRRAQWIFMGVYMVTQALVFSIYTRVAPRGAGPWILAILCISKRLHSIYMLRLFNDGVTMMLLYAAVLAFSHRRWRVGCLVFSLAFSIKMNVILFAPALFVLMVKDLGMRETIYNILGICAPVQVVLAMPFMVLGGVKNYIRGAFGGFGDLKHKWTVNWKFIPEEIFLSRLFGVMLVCALAVTLLYVAHTRWCAGEGGLLRSFRCQPLYSKSIMRHVTPRHVTHVMFSCNFIGVALSRSLHFQFYCWYWHAVPLLLWCHPGGENAARRFVGHAMRLMVIAGLEFSWSYCIEPVEGTSTPGGSIVLQLCHIAILAAIFWSDGKATSKSFEYVACPGDKNIGNLPNSQTVPPEVIASFNNCYSDEFEVAVQQMTGKATAECHGVALTRVANWMAACQLIDGYIIHLRIRGEPIKTEVSQPLAGSETDYQPRRRRTHHRNTGFKAITTAEELLQSFVRTYKS